MMVKHTPRALIFFAVLAVTAKAQAQEHRPPPHRPPPEAFEACDGASEGDACAVSTPHGTMEGTCRAPEGELFCMPNRPPGHHHRPPQPPPEAFEACDGASEGDACAVEMPHGTIEGTCQLPEEQLVCVPDRPPERPHRRPPPEAFEACDGASEGDACAVETPRGAIEGSCRPHQDDALVCVPNGPPPPPRPR